MGGTAGDLTVNGPGSGGTAITYNPASQLTGITRSNPTDLYAWTGHYNINRAYGTNGLNQLTSAGATALGYDGRGNLTSSGSSLYSYTSENRLATAPSGATLTYDPTGRLSRVVQGINDTKFEHLGPRLIIERNGAGTILRRYVHGPGDDEPVVWYEGVNLTTKRFLHTDERGSVIAVTGATGASIATNKYDEYGIPQSSVGTLAPGTSGRFMYTGQMWIPELGLYYYKARFYSPTLGRFMQTDPIGYEDGINWYAYVANDPVNMVDPNGEREVYVGGASDAFSGIVKDEADRRARSGEAIGKVFYFEHDQSRYIKVAIESTPRGEPLNLIGHSLGGAEVIRQASDTDQAIRNLVTIDPVDLPGSTLEVSDVPGGNVARWTNVTANPEKNDWSDTVADAGGKVDPAVTDMAEENIVSKRHHGQFVRMLEEAKKKMVK